MTSFSYLSTSLDIFIMEVVVLQKLVYESRVDAFILSYRSSKSVKWLLNYEAKNFLKYSLAVAVDSIAKMPSHGICTMIMIIDCIMIFDSVFSIVLNAY